MQSFLPLIVLSCVACVMGYRHVARNAPGLHIQANHSNGLQKAALLVIDVQKSFMTGELAVPGVAVLESSHFSYVKGLAATNMIDNVKELLALDWKTVVVTEDKHPAEHISFSTSHPKYKNPVLPMKWNNVSGDAILCQVGDDSYWAANKKEYKEVYKNKMVDKCAAHKCSAQLNAEECYVEHNQVLWPKHCIVGTTGDETHPGIIKYKPGRNTFVVQKGRNPVVDSYSAIANNIGIPEFEGLVLDVGQAGTTLSNPKKTWADILHGVDEVFVVGLATDFCVANTARHTLTLMGKTTYIIKEATLGVWLAEDQQKNPGPEKNVAVRVKAAAAFEAKLQKEGIQWVGMEEVRQKAKNPGNMLEIGAKADFS